jgi:dihydropteroate synthase
MMPKHSLRHARGEISFDHCLVMGIVNRTPDSFFDGGRMELNDARGHALKLIDEGADIIDLGAVKAGPGEPVDERTEMQRLLPLIDILARVPVPLSVETARSGVARAALEGGAAIINDVSAFADPGIAAVCAEFGAAVILMHHGGQIRGRPRHPRYSDVVEEVKQVWSALASTAAGHGIKDDQIIVDPGLDFGKTTFHSLELMKRIDELVNVRWPVLIAGSRKDVVGESLGLPPEERLEGSLALAALAVAGGAEIVRAHDVEETVRTVRMVEVVAGRRAPATVLRGLWD